MRISDYLKTEAYEETKAHAISGVQMALTSGSKAACVPANCHVTLGLLIPMMVSPMGQEILASLSDFFQKNPDVAAQVWEAIKESVDGKVDR